MICEQIVNERLKRTYSDAGYKICQEQTGELYDEAIDVISAGFTYTETEIPVAGEEEASAEDVMTALEEVL